MRGNVHVRFGGRGWEDLRLRSRQGVLPSTRHLPLDQVATSFLFQLVSKRYTKGSIIVTSNKSHAEWGSVFGDEVAAAAVIDRLLHHSTTVNIRGESYRLKDKKRAGVFSTPAARSAS